MNKRILIVSDALGETAIRVLRAALTQFDRSNVKLETFAFIETKDKIDNLLPQITENDMVAFTLADPELSIYLVSCLKDRKLRYLDLLSLPIRILGEFLEQNPSAKAGQMQNVDEVYFKRIDAIEFAVKYDDGKNPNGLKEADIVLLGISRTSKTPLSMYLAGMSYKVANIPVVPEVDLPSQLYRVDRHKMFGLTNDIDELVRIRRERMKVLGFSDENPYSDVERIKSEIRYADDLFADLGIMTINVSGKAVEETASTIVRALKETERSDL